MHLTTLVLSSLALAASAFALPATSLFSFTPVTQITRRDNWDVTRNDLLNGPCKPVLVIFARGTIELGNVGTFAGPPFFNAFTDIIGDSNLAVQGVDYGATVIGYLEGGDPAGASTMASLTNQAVSQCPQSQIILAGYSQGAQVVHLAARQLSSFVASQIKAVVLFGDPDDGQALSGMSSGNVVTFCFATDLICDGAPIVLPAHLSYSLDAPAAAQFAVSHVQV